ncbi:MAG: hypothetical protein J1E41_00360 [Ruminococcus sp.]|nr:hypothetical protein [Ruminococcus sp.]
MKNTNLVKRTLSIILAFAILMSLATGIAVNAAPAKFGDNIIPLAFEKKYTGTAGDEADPNTYSFTIAKSGKVDIVYTSDKAISLYLYDQNGDKLDSYFNSDIIEPYYLKSGTYYLQTGRSLFSYDKVPFSLIVSYQSSKETFVETQNSNDDTPSLANKIALGKRYYGHLGRDDSYDYFKFTVPKKGTVTVEYQGVEYANCRFYDSDLNECFRLFDSPPVTKVFNFSKGTYYFVTGRSNRGGAYNFILNYKPSIAKASITKATRKGTKATIKLKKISSADGYQIAYSTSKKFAKSKTKFVTTKKTKATIKKLKKNKTYYVRARAYIKHDKKTFYGSYSAKKVLKKKK